MPRQIANGLNQGFPGRSGLTIPACLETKYYDLAQQVASGQSRFYFHLWHQRRPPEALLSAYKQPGTILPAGQCC